MINNNAKTIGSLHASLKTAVVALERAAEKDEGDVIIKGSLESSKETLRKVEEMLGIR